MSSSKPLTEVIHCWSEVFMRRSARDFKRFMSETGLSLSQISILMRLYHRGGHGGISDVGEHLMVTKAAASQTIDRLVQLGLVERSEDLVDRRLKKLSLTPKGQALVSTGITIRSQWVEGLTEALDAEEQEMIISALTLLTEAALKIEE
jgi:DNA-binding MarR family transcriptional regulator